MRHRYAIWTAFVLVHLWLAFLCLNAQGLPLGDVTLVYLPWAEQSFDGIVPGVDADWVYPVLAILPMLLAHAAGVAWYGQAWLVIVVLLDAVGLAVLLGTGRSERRAAAAWWWLVFIAFLGPIALARVDAVTVPIAVIALVLVLRVPWLGGGLLAVATWMKIWPAAVIAALVVAFRRRWTIIAAGAVVTFTIVAVVTGLGGVRHLFSFVTEQTGRGLQIEAPISTFYMWCAALGVPGSFVYYDRDILTYQVTGANVDVVIALATPLLAVAVLAVVLIGMRATRAGASAVRVLPDLVLALVLCLIAFNKVGSPQFMVWLIAPVAFGVVVRGWGYFVPALGGIALAGLTQVIYPYLYWMLVDAQIAMVVVLTVRNLLTLALLFWAIASLWRTGTDAVRRVVPEPVALAE